MKKIILTGKTLTWQVLVKMAMIGRKFIAQIHLSSEQPVVLTDYVVVCLDKEYIQIASLITDWLETNAIIFVDDFIHCLSKTEYEMKYRVDVTV